MSIGKADYSHYLAHWIRNTRTRAFAAVSCLEAQRRWCLAGTPVQNGLSDAFSLTKFLRFSPFAEPKDIRKFVTGPLSRHDKQGLVNLQRMMETCSIRRAKGDLNLPLANSIQISVTLSESERFQYDQVQRKLFADLGVESRRGSNKTSILVLQCIHKLRRICCHGLSRDVLPDRVPQSKLLLDEAVCDECGTRIAPKSRNSAFYGHCCHWVCNKCSKPSLETHGGTNIPSLSCPICGSSEETLVLLDPAKPSDELFEDTSGVPASNEKKFVSAKIGKVVETLNLLHPNHKEWNHCRPKRYYFPLNNPNCLVADH